MKLLVIFGLPGTGKTFVGKILEKYFAYHFYDGDQDMPKRLTDALEQHTTVTDDMRQEFFDKLRESVRRLQKKYKKIVIAQTYIKDIYRRQLLEEFPQARFIFVETDMAIREDRLLKRKGFQAPLEYWRKMYSMFDAPQIPHLVITNGPDGEDNIKQQLQDLLR